MGLYAVEKVIWRQSRKKSKNGIITMATWLDW